MIGAYVESLKLRVGTFIGLAAVLGYLATLPSAPPTGGPALSAIALLFAATVIAAGGAGALNHVLDRDLDARMPRTAGRPLPSGRIPHVWHVAALGVGLVVIGVSLAFWRLHPLVALHVFLGAFTYVVVYTVWLKRRSWLNVVIGGLAGSFAVLAGGSAARPRCRSCARASRARRGRRCCGRRRPRRPRPWGASAGPTRGSWRWRGRRR